MLVVALHLVLLVIGLRVVVVVVGVDGRDTLPEEVEKGGGFRGWSNHLLTFVGLQLHPLEVLVVVFRAAARSLPGGPD